MKFHKEISFLNRSVTGVAADIEEMRYFDPSSYDGTHVFYFEVIAANANSSAQNVYLHDAAHNIHATAVVPASSSMGRIRVTCSTDPTIDYYHLSPGHADITLYAARLIMIQTTVYNFATTSAHVDIGSYIAAGYTDSAIVPMPYPKYWYFDYDNWGGQLVIFVDLVWQCLNSKYWLSVYLQMDDGSFGGWTNVGTVLSQGGSEAVNYTFSADLSASFVSERHYRLAYQTEAAAAKYGCNIFNANLIVLSTPWRYVDNYPRSFYYARECWGYGGYVAAAEDTGGLGFYSVSNGVLTLIEAVADGTANGVFMDADFVFCCYSSTQGITSYTWDAAGVTKVDNYDPGTNCLNCYYADGILFVAAGSSGVLTFTVDGSGNLTYVDAATDSTTGFFDVFVQDGILFAAGTEDGLFTYTYDGSGNLTFVDSDDQSGATGATIGVSGDGNFIYAANEAGGVLSYAYDGSGNLTYKATNNWGTYAYDIWCQNGRVYVGWYTDGMAMYEVNPSTGAFTLLNTIAFQQSAAWGMWGDGTYIYSGQGNITGTIVTIFGVNKFEEYYNITNLPFNAGTGLQGAPAYYDPADWDGIDVEFFHENCVYDGGANYDADTKLQEDPNGTPADISGSTLTDIIQRERSSALTMPSTAKEIDLYVTSFGTASYICASRIIVKIVEAVATGWTGKIWGTTAIGKIDTADVANIEKVTGVP